VLADRGYFEGYQILECERASIATMVPKPLTSNSRAEGSFDKRDFIYDAQSDPIAARLDRSQSIDTPARDAARRCIGTSACPRCPIKGQCTPGDYRRIARSEHEDVLD
jgi:hypothetical protein